MNRAKGRACAVDEDLEFLTKASLNRLLLDMRGSYGRQGLSGAAGQVSAKALDQKAVQQRAEAGLLLSRQSLK